MLGSKSADQIRRTSHHCLNRLVPTNPVRRQLMNSLLFLGHYWLFLTPWVICNGVCSCVSLLIACVWSIRKVFLAVDEGTCWVRCSDFASISSLIAWFTSSKNSQSWLGKYILAGLRGVGSSTSKASFLWACVAYINSIRVQSLIASLARIVSHILTLTKLACPIVTYVDIRATLLHNLIILLAWSSGDHVGDLVFIGAELVHNLTSLACNRLFLLCGR